MTRLRKRLSFDSLERRDLLATVYPSDFVGPIVKDGVYGPVAMYDFPPPVVPPGAPLTSVNGVSTNSIGGGVDVVVTAPTGFKFKKVVYTITGGAVEHQNWSTTTASYTPTSGETRTWAGNDLDPYVASDTYGFYWDEKTGARNVTIKVTYSDAASTEKTVQHNFTVVAPEITSIKMYGSGTQFAVLNNTHVGFVEKLMVYPVSGVSSTPSIGTLGYVQMVTSSTAKWTGTTKIREMVYPTGLKVLDWNTGWPNPYMTDYSLGVQQSSTLLTFGGLNKAWDKPELNAEIPTAGVSNIWKKLETNTQLDTYLDWMPSGGIHVAVAKVSWSFEYSATYTGSLTRPQVYSEYKLADKWTVSINHPDVWTNTGGAVRKILTWTTNAADAMEQYTTTTNLP